jgi:hypothetical protein
VKLPPSEAAFRQPILRVAFQVYVWTHANEAKPPPRSPLEYGWRNENKYLMPKYFEGPMTSDFLQDPVCVCKSKSICSKNCVCFEQNLSCTSICGCQGNEECSSMCPYIHLECNTKYGLSKCCFRWRKFHKRGIFFDKANFTLSILRSL